MEKLAVFINYFGFHPLLAPRRVWLHSMMKYCSFVIYLHSQTGTQQWYNTGKDTLSFASFNWVVIDSYTFRNNCTNKRRID